ncbi:MAG: DNA replication protein [Alphaproteobacteria bacterium]|nr:DNA replication protein [Alphaproteobacteria bacterium]
MMTSQFVFEFPHRPAFGEVDFLVAPSNAEAVAWIDRWPRWPAPILILWGPAGCGKTHLAHVWRARSGAPAVPAAALTRAAVPSLLGAPALAVVDDADGAAEQPLLHLVNLIAEGRGQLLLTAAQPPARWTTRLADLRSRLVAAPLVAVQPPDDALIGAVLLKLFADRQLVVGEEVILFLLRHMERSFAAARRLVTALDQAALAAQRRITVPLARAVLDDDATQAPPSA